MKKQKFKTTLIDLNGNSIKPISDEAWRAASAAATAKALAPLDNARTPYGTTLLLKFSAVDLERLDEEVHYRQRIYITQPGRREELTEDEQAAVAQLIAEGRLAQAKGLTEDVKRRKRTVRRMPTRHAVAVEMLHAALFALPARPAAVTSTTKGAV